MGGGGGGVGVGSWDIGQELGQCRDQQRSLISVETNKGV